MENLSIFVGKPLNAFIKFGGGTFVVVVDVVLHKMELIAHGSRLGAREHITGGQHVQRAGVRHRVRGGRAALRPPDHAGLLLHLLLDGGARRLRREVLPVLVRISLCCYPIYSGG